MKFLVLGGTGRTGVLFVARALDGGHRVTAIVRSADAPLDARVQRIVGDVTDAGTIAAASAGMDVIVSTLGVNGRRGTPTLITDTVRAVIGAAGTSGVNRFLIVSAFGVGDSIGVASLRFRLLVRIGVRNIYRDKTASEVLLRNSQLRWTAVYPGALKDGAPTPYTARALDDITRVPGIPATTRANIADFLLASAVDMTFDRQAVVLIDAPRGGR
jgi:putative NADH-flavin reductase